MEKEQSQDLNKLQVHLNEVLDRMEQNSSTLRRFQAFETQMLNITSLSELINFILKEGKSFFALDELSFCLIDKEADIHYYLHDDGFDIKACSDLIVLENNSLIRSIFGFKHKPYIGNYDSSKCARFFPQPTRQPESVAIIPVVRRNQILGSLNMGSYRSDRFVKDMATDFVEHMVSVISVCLENILNFETLKRTSYIDELTGVNNRRFLEQRIIEEICQSQRAKTSLACLFFDIDHFKSINDNYGHQAGDYVLSLVASTIKKQLRAHDVLARFGGEEFIALLVDVDTDLTREIAERIRVIIESLDIKIGEQQIKVTISVGYTIFIPEENMVRAEDVVPELIKSADTAMYLAKKKGRNRVEIKTFSLYQQAKNMTFV